MPHHDDLLSPPRPGQPPSGASYAVRVGRLLLGLVLCGLGIAVMVAADLGLGPWDVLHQGISRLTGIPIGTVGIGVGALVLLLWWPLRERPGVGTVANVIVIGLVIDGALLVLETPTSLVARVALMALGPVAFAIGSGYYIGARLGPGPRDGVMTGLARRGVPVGRARTGIEVVVLIAGVLLGGTAGIGTIAFTATIGPLVAFFLPRLTVRSDDDVTESVRIAEPPEPPADGQRQRASSTG